MRKERDSNPRTDNVGKRFSRPSRSTTPASFRGYVSANIAETVREDFTLCCLVYFIIYFLFSFTTSLPSSTILFFISAW